MRALIYGIAAALLLEQLEQLAARLLGWWFVAQIEQMLRDLERARESGPQL